MRVRRSVLTSIAIAALAAWTAVGRDARADETRDCAAAYEATQRLQQKGDFVAALESADRCARPSCPALLKDECTQWTTDIRSKLPSLVVRVRGSDGCVRPEAKVDVGGGSRREPGSEVYLVDPGVHEIKVTDPASSKTKLQTINFAPGERRDIDVDFGRGAACTNPELSSSMTEPAPARSPFLRLSRTTLVLSAVGGGLVLLGGTFGVIGAVKRGDLDECKPDCPQERIDDVRPFLVIGDVLAGFGLLALGAAVVTFFSVDAKGSPRAPAATTSVRLRLGPGGLAGTF